MRADAAAVLVAMGFKPMQDFIAYQDESGLRIDWRAQQAIPADADIAAYDMSPATVAARDLSALRVAATAAVNNPDASGKRFRALMLVVLDEINLLRAAVIPSLPARTVTQLKTAVNNKITSGAAD